MGRRLKFETPEKLQESIDAYFKDCDPHVATVQVINTKNELQTVDIITKQRPYTITALAVWLDTSRETLMNYEDKEKYFDTIKKAKDKVHSYVEERLFDTNAAGVIFNLKNNFGWRDKTETDITTNGENINVAPDPKMAADFASYLKNQH